MTYRTADRHLAARHRRLETCTTYATPDSPTPVSATEADLMNLSGHEDRRTLQHYLKPSKDGTHRRLDEIDAQPKTWTPNADELAGRMSTQ